MLFHKPKTKSMKGSLRLHTVLAVTAHEIVYNDALEFLDAPNANQKR